MNKVAAEIIAGVIPNKMARNRWRGILRFGIGNALRLKRELKKDKTKPKHYLTIGAIAKNEGQYFKEWIEWHRKMGVEKFYIYDNESTDNTKEVLQPYIDAGIVEYKYFPGKGMQLAAYDDILLHHRLESRWIGLIDIDEFIMPMKDRNLVEFLKRFEDAPCVEINWLCYGSSGAKKQEPGGVMERFTRHALPEDIQNRGVKTIFNPRRVFSMIGAHEVARINGKAVDSHGDRIRAGFRDREPQHDVIRINHYAVKSYEEFKQKQGRGRVRGKESKRIKGDRYFKIYDLNDIEEPVVMPGSAPSKARD